MKNLRELLETRAAAMPQKTWLFSAADDRRWSYAEFDAAVNQAANLLLSLGVGKGDKVSLMMANS
ncbi:MAG: AMP-binding protein, partial [Blastocatellia bacterium]